MQTWVAPVYIGLSLTAGLLVHYPTKAGERPFWDQRLVVLALADDLSFQLPAWTRNNVNYAILMIWYKRKKWDRTMYGLSLTANLLCASATRRLAAATLRARSSFADGELLVRMVGEDALGNGFTGVGTAKVLSGFGFIAATFAAISARFWAMSASADGGGKDSQHMHTLVTTDEAGLLQPEYGCKRAREKYSFNGGKSDQTFRECRSLVVDPLKSPVNLALDARDCFNCVEQIFALSMSLM
jgi:hypothetical protein